MLCVRLLLAIAVGKERRNYYYRLDGLGGCEQNTKSPVQTPMLDVRRRKMFHCSIVQPLLKRDTLHAGD